MEVIRTISDLRSTIKKLKSEGNTVGFVPTMGALHAGHGSLIKASVGGNSKTVVSIFVNPTQFGPNEDLDKYPRVPKEDSDLVKQLNGDIIFMPSPKEMYPFDQMEILFGVKSLGNTLCGAKRSGHFEGVIQVVSKLFNIVQPDRAYFGEKDYQQLAIIRRMTIELNFPVEIVGCPIFREKDGLAMSSRNRYLSSEERAQSVFLSQSLFKLAEKIKTEKSVVELKKWINEEITSFPIARLDYFEIINGDSLENLETIDDGIKVVALLAVHYGKTRLIDNHTLKNL